MNRRHMRALVGLMALGLAACGAADEGLGGELELTVSGEGLGANGYAFPPTAGQEIAIVDGWSIEFDRIVVAIDNIRISEMPDKNPGDQGQVGKTVLVRKGPFVVDLKGRGNAMDKGGAGKVAIMLPVRDLKDHFALDERYAFGFDLVPVTADSTFVNISKSDADVRQMIDSGLRSLLVGRAEFKGKDCRSSSSSYDFGKLPKEVDIRIGLRGRVAYANCQNPDNQGSALDGEEFQRGIQLLAHGTTVAQITIHTDHLFWPTVAHENLPLFDPYAANAREKNGRFSVELEDLSSVRTPGITDRDGVALPWRSCVTDAMYKMPTVPEQVTFDDNGQGLSTLEEFVRFNATTMGHLNADGLCHVATRGSEGPSN